MRAAALRVACLGIALSVTSSLAQAWTVDDVGLCFEGSSNPELDLHHCSLAIDAGGLSGRSLATLFVQRGRAFVAIARLEHAIVDFERALELNPLSAEAHHGRGLAHHAAGNYVAAIRDFDAALELSPSFVEALRSRATARLFDGDLAGAVRDYDAELARVPLDDVGRILRGLAHYAGGDYVRALEDLSPAAASGYPYRFLPLWHFLAKARSGGDGRAQLVEARAELAASEWPAILLDYYLAQADAAAVSATLAAMPAALRAERQAEAALFLGELARLANDTAAGRRHLAAAAAAEASRSVEWALARALLAQSRY